MTKEKEERCRIKINVSTGELEAEGSRQFVEKILNEYGNKIKSAVPVISPKVPLQLKDEIKEKQTAQVFAKKVNIRDFYLEKRPRNDKEAATVVAFYLSEVAESSERKTQMNEGILNEYLKKAGHTLPTNAGQTLRNAKFIGFLDSGDSRGEFKISAIGYNLVAHQLPSEQVALSDTKTKKKKQSKKTKSKK